MSDQAKIYKANITAQLAFPHRCNHDLEFVDKLTRDAGRPGDSGTFIGEGTSQRDLEVHTKFTTLAEIENWVQEIERRLLLYFSDHRDLVRVSYLFESPELGFGIVNEDKTHIDFDDDEGTGLSIPVDNLEIIPTRPIVYGTFMVQFLDIPDFVTFEQAQSMLNGLGYSETVWANNVEGPTVFESLRSIREWQEQHALHYLHKTLQRPEVTVNIYLRDEDENHWIFNEDFTELTHEGETISYEDDVLIEPGEKETYLCWSVAEEEFQECLLWAKGYLAALDEQPEHIETVAEIIVRYRGADEHYYSKYDTTHYTYQAAAAALREDFWDRHQREQGKK